MTQPPPPALPTATPPGTARSRRRATVLKIVLGLVGLAVAMGALGYFYRAEILTLSRAFVDRLGGPGIAGLIFLPDAFAVPIIHDVITGLGLLGGMGFAEVIAWATLGSLAGGCVGFGIGRRLSHTAWFLGIMEGRGAAAHRLVQRYGVTAIAIGALTPLPYSWTCWAAGALGMRFLPFLLTSVLRIPRLAGYLWMVQLGFVSFAA